jgi:hypothetical protein
MGTSVRRAKPDDIDWLLGQLKRFAQFYGTKKSLFGDEVYAREFLSQKIESHPFFIAENDSGPIGFISGYLHLHPYNPDIHVLNETFWWVDEAHRGSRAGILLLNAFLEFGYEYSADWIVFTLESHSPVRDETLTRRGFRVHERSFLLEVA